MFSDSRPPRYFAPMRASCFNLSFMSWIAVFAALCAGTLAAQVPAPTAPDADAAYTRHDWPVAEKLYSALTQQEPANARYWYRLAVAERGNQRFAPSLESFKRAAELGAGNGLPKSLVDYEEAATYAGMGDRANALKLLKDAADGGFLQTARLETDSEWSALRTQADFQVLAKQVNHNA